MKQINKIIGFTVVVFIIAAISMMFLPAVSFLDEVYDGKAIIFGYTSHSSISYGPFSYTKDTVIFQFSFLCMLSYILLAVALLLELISLFTTNKLVNLLVAVCTIAAGVLLVFTPQFIVIGEDIKKIYDYLGTNYTADISLQYGIIVTMVLAFVSGFISLMKLMLPKGKKR